MQQRIDDLESMKNNSTGEGSTAARLETISSSSDDDLSRSTSSDEQSLFNFDQRSWTEDQAPQSSLDRSRLTIFLPFAHNAPLSPSEKRHSTEFNLVPGATTTGSVEDVATIATEVSVTVLSRENSHAASPLLYSKAILNRTVQFRSAT